MILVIIKIPDSVFMIDIFIVIIIAIPILSLIAINISITIIVTFNTIKTSAAEEKKNRIFFLSINSIIAYIGFSPLCFFT